MIYLDTDCTKENLSGMAKFLGEYWKGSDVAQTSYQVWHCLENPVGEAICTLAKKEDTDEIIGAWKLMPMMMRCFGKDVLAGTGGDFMCQKESASLATLLKMGKARFKLAEDLGMKFNYGTPNKNSFPVMHKIYQFNHIASIPSLILPLRPKRVVQAKISPTLALFIPDIPYKGFFTMDKKLKVTEINEKDISIFDEFWEQVKDKYPIMGVRNAAYVKWRYYQNPVRCYTVFGAWEDNKLVGYTSLRLYEARGIKVGSFADFLVLTKRKDAAAALISNAVDFFHRNGVELSHCLISGHSEEARFLKHKGFIRNPKGIHSSSTPLIVKTFDSKLSTDIENYANWFFTLGDTDNI